MTPSSAIPRPPAGEGGTRDSGRVRAKEKPVPKDGIYIGVDPRDLPDFAVFRTSTRRGVRRWWCCRRASS